jgi:transposase
LQALSFGIFWLKIKKVQEKNKLAPESIDGMFCQELKTVLKRTIDVWNEYHEGAKVFEDLVKEKEQTISRMVELLSLPIEHKDTRRVRRRIIKYNQELFTFLDNPLLRQPISGLKRQLRPKVIMRKITFGNRSTLEALNQAVMMSIIQTGILNGIEPLNILLGFISKASNFTYGIAKDKVAMNLKSRG